jgi:hypothetical protein
LIPKASIADNVRLRAGKVYAIRRTPQRAAIIGAAIMAEILAGRAELW